MKRVGNLFEEIASMDNLKQAYANAKRGKGWYHEVIEIEKDVDYYLSNIQGMLQNKTFTTSEYEIFTKVDKGKTREIYKLPFYPDRIVQWALMQVIEPYIVRNLTANTYSAIPGRGMHACLKQVKHDIRLDEEGSQFCLKIDVKKYYPHINHQILKEKFRRVFKDPDVLWLLDDIIDSTEGDTGIPIGNYVSQYSGNFYLSDFDHWLKEEKHVKYYYRYMDDCVILSDDKAFLHALLEDIKVYLADILKLELKENYQIFPTYVRGIDLVGYRIFKDYVLVRKSIVKQMKAKLKPINRKVAKGKPLTKHDVSMINSYAGWLKSADAHRLTNKYIRPLLPYVNEYLEKERKACKNI